MAITKIEVPELFDFGSDNSAFKLPTGTTAERPTSPSNGEMRFNTTTGYVEYYDTTDTQWWEIDYETVCTTNDPNYPITNLAYYKMSDASDSSGNGYNGTATNVNFNVAGEFGNAGEFNGSSSYIDLGNNSSNNSSTISVSLWFKTNGQSGTGTLINNGGANSNETGYYLGLTSSGYLRFNGGNPTNIDGSVDYADGSWHNVIMTLNNGAYSIYIDGNTTPVITGTGAFTSTATRPTWIGRFSYTPLAIEFFNGSIDQIRIFDSALNASQVTQLYNETQCVPTIVPSENFNTVLYTGNGTTQSITSLDFQPDFTWIKQRNIPQNHRLFDSVRGATNILSSSNTNAQGTNSQTLTSFNSNGFSLGNNVAVNTNSGTYVSWNWKAGGTAVSNTDGTITTQVSANVDAGFSIVQYTAAGNQSFGHGLSQAPELIIQKLYSTTSGWYVYSAPTGLQKYLQLNSTAALSGTDSSWITAVTNTTFTANWSGNSYSYINYCFHSVDGYSKIGSYTGTGATGNVQYVGFEPAFVMVKATSTSEPWFILDNKRDPNNPRDNRLMPDSTAAESNGSVHTMDFNSNNFTLNGTVGNGTNGSGQTYIFLAIAADPT